MQVKDIRLLDVEIIKDEKKVFDGKVEDSYNEFGKCYTDTINFKDGKMIINLK